MKLNGVHHVSINVSDVAAATPFYTEILGLETLERPDFQFPGLWLKSGDSEIHLIEVKDWQAPKGQHFAFGVDDIEAARTRLKSQGVDSSEPSEIPGVCLQCFLKDPAGNLIELNQRL